VWYLAALSYVDGVRAWHMGTIIRCSISYSFRVLHALRFPSRRSLSIQLPLSSLVLLEIATQGIRIFPSLNSKGLLRLNTVEQDRSYTMNVNMARTWASRLAFVLASTHLISSAFAQDSTSIVPLAVQTPMSSATGSAIAATSMPASSRNAQIHTIKVGAGGFHFQPQQISDVAVGDTVTFEFYPPDHSVARAEFGSACVPYESTGKGRQGFWSGTQYVDTVNEVHTYHHALNTLLS